MSGSCVEMQANLLSCRWLCFLHTLLSERLEGEKEGGERGTGKEGLEILSSRYQRIDESVSRDAGRQVRQGSCLTHVFSPQPMFGLEKLFRETWRKSQNQNRSELHLHPGF